MRTKQIKWFVEKTVTCTSHGAEQCRFNFFSGKLTDALAEVEQEKNPGYGSNDPEHIDLLQKKADRLRNVTGNTLYVRQDFNHISFSLSAQHNLDDPNQWYATAITGATLDARTLKALAKLLDCQGPQAIDKLTATHVTFLSLCHEYIVK